jgi:hypothetical protein
VIKIHRMSGHYVGKGDPIVDIHVDDIVRVTFCAPFAGKIMRCREVGYSVTAGEKITELTGVGTPTWELFHSYRRTDAPGQAGRIGERLINYFGPGQVFKDIESLPPAANYIDFIREKLTLAHVMVVVIGPNWAADSRLRDSDDLHREEVRTAIERGIHIVPVLVDGAKMPRKEDVPSDLLPLIYRGAIEITDSRWDYDVGRVVETVERLLADSPKRKNFLKQVPSWDHQGLHWITDNPRPEDLD